MITKLEVEKLIEDIRKDYKYSCVACMHPQEVGWCENHCYTTQLYNRTISALNELKLYIN